MHGMCSRQVAAGFIRPQQCEGSVHCCRRLQPLDQPPPCEGRFCRATPWTARHRTRQGHPTQSASQPAATTLMRPCLAGSSAHPVTALLLTGSASLLTTSLQQEPCLTDCWRQDTLWFVTDSCCAPRAHYATHRQRPCLHEPRSQGRPLPPLQRCALPHSAPAVACLLLHPRRPAACPAQLPAWPCRKARRTRHMHKHIACHHIVC